MKLSSLFVPPPVKARHVKRTYVTSPDDRPGAPSRELILLALDAARASLDVDLSDIGARIRSGPRWTDIWPGEHYRLLAAFVQLLQPKIVVEVGTFTGLSSLALKQLLPADGKVFSFDLIPWQEIPDTILKESDFQDGRLVQVLGNLADPACFRQHAKLLSEATLIFADGPKDGKFEPAFYRQLGTLTRKTDAWLLWDDILDLHMLQLWRDIERPKMDLTSFGHWTGTGLMHWAATGA
jgi:predicted O-methyltransferase YrrM